MLPVNATALLLSLKRPAGSADWSPSQWLAQATYPRMRAIFRSSLDVTAAVDGVVEAKRLARGIACLFDLDGPARWVISDYFPPTDPPVANGEFDAVRGSFVDREFSRARAEKHPLLAPLFERTLSLLDLAGPRAADSRDLPPATAEIPNAPPVADSIPAPFWPAVCKCGRPYHVNLKAAAGSKHEGERVVADVRDGRWTCCPDCLAWNQRRWAELIRRAAASWADLVRARRNGIVTLKGRTKSVGEGDAKKAVPDLSKREESNRRRWNACPSAADRTGFVCAEGEATVYVPPIDAGRMTADELAADRVRAFARFHGVGQGQAHALYLADVEVAEWEHLSRLLPKFAAEYAKMLHTTTFDRFDVDGGEQRGSFPLESKEEKSSPPSPRLLILAVVNRSDRTDGVVTVPSAFTEVGLDDAVKCVNRAIEHVARELPPEETCPVRSRVSVSRGWSMALADLDEVESEANDGVGFEPGGWVRDGASAYSAVECADQDAELGISTATQLRDERVYASAGRSDDLAGGPLCGWLLTRLRERTEDGRRRSREFIVAQFRLWQSLLAGLSDGRHARAAEAAADRALTRYRLLRDKAEMPGNHGDDLLVAEAKEAMPAAEREMEARKAAVQKAAAARDAAEAELLLP